MIGDTSKDVEILKKLSIYGFYDPVDLAHGGEILGINLIYIGVIIILFLAALMVFKKKRLPL